MQELLLNDVQEARSGTYEFALGAGGQGRKNAVQSCIRGYVYHSLDAWHALEAHLSKVPDVDLS